MSVSEARNKKDMIRWGVTLALGMLVYLWRVVLPTNVEITVGIAVLETVLSLTLTATLIFINRQELKKRLIKKITGKDVLKTIVTFIVVIFFGVALDWLALFNLIFGVDIVPSQPPTAWVAGEFARVFPLGLFISSVIAAPIWEEIAFRMAGRNLFSNKIFFVLITTFLFVFIHTGFALTTGLTYAVAGILFGIAYLVTKDLRIMMFVHSLWNLMVHVTLLS